MAEFDRIDGLFIATQCTFAERLIFQRSGWKVTVIPVVGKKWATPDVEKARIIAKYAVGAAKVHLENAEAIRQTSVDASWAEDSDVDIPAPEGLAYMPFQRAGIDYASKRARTLIADPPGLGKTIQAIGTHNKNKMSSVLVVCPASLKINWSREWRRWDVHGLTVGIAMSIPCREPIFEKDGTRARDPNTKLPLSRTWTEHSWPDTDVVIINYDMLPAFDDEVKAQRWDMAVFDEAHLLKTATATRTMCVFGGKKKARKKRDEATGRMKTIERAKHLQPIVAGHHLYLTGTPILSKPVELWTLLRACDPKGLGKSWDNFVFEYCGAFEEFVNDTQTRIVTDGSSNLDELNRLMRERFMVRRDKKAVLKDLPPKTREMIMLPADKLEKPLKKERTRVETALEGFEAMLGVDPDANPFRYIDVIGMLSDKLADALSSQDGEEPDWNAAVRTLSEPEQIMFTELSEAREEVALAKVGLVTEHVKKLVECDEPVILFGYHKSVIEELKTRLEKAGIRVGIVTGKVSPNKRQAVVDAFQEGEIDVIIGNILAMGVGFTLTRASIVVFAELDWVPAMIEQAEDRAWRHGQLNAVLIQHLVVDGSIEARMAITLLAKMGVIYEALDERAAPEAISA
jgi:SNF2 family DNA or RNA helicase